MILFTSRVYATKEESGIDYVFSMAQRRRGEFHSVRPAWRHPNYASSRSNDGQIDNEKVGQGRAGMDVHQPSKWSTLVAVEAGYTRMSNRVTPSTDTEDFSGILCLVLADL
jgi:hypothetical protein